MDDNPYQSPAPPQADLTPLLPKCPRCGGVMNAGFMIANSGLGGFASMESISKPIYATETIVGAGWFSILPSFAKWFKASLCRTCRLLVIDYSKKLSHSDAKQFALNHTQSQSTP